MAKAMGQTGSQSVPHVNSDGGISGNVRELPHAFSRSLRDISRREIDEAPPPPPPTPTTSVPVPRALCRAEDAVPEAQTLSAGGNTCLSTVQQTIFACQRIVRDDPTALKAWRCAAGQRGTGMATAARAARPAQRARVACDPPNPARPAFPPFVSALGSRLRGTCLCPRPSGGIGGCISVAVKGACGNVTEDLMFPETCVVLCAVPQLRAIWRLHWLLRAVPPAPPRPAPVHYRIRSDARPGLF